MERRLRRAYQAEGMAGVKCGSEVGGRLSKGRLGEARAQTTENELRLPSGGWLLVQSRKDRKFAHCRSRG